MVDNVTANAGAGGATFKTDDDGTAHWPYTKQAFGADNTQTRVTASVGLPVELLAGTAAFGKLSANSGVDIGDVDVTSQIPGTGATNLGKAIDTAAGATDTGVAALVIRDDTLTTLTPVDGDYVPLRVGSTGALHTSITGTVTISGAVTNAGTFVVQEDGAALTALQLLDNAVSGSGYNITQLNGVNVTMGNGVSGTGVQRVTLASDGTGQVKLAAGTAGIGKLTANSGVDIGDVDVTSLIPGAGATNLGKAIDSAAGATDVGVAMLVKHLGDTAHVTISEEDYDVLRSSDFGALHVEPEQHHVIDNMNALAGGGGTWAAIDSDTTGVATSTSHVLGSNSIEFDKVDGAANSGIGGITKALTSVNLGGISPHDILQTIVRISATTEIDGGSAFFFLRLGTDSTDYNEWRIDGTEFTAGDWETVVFEIGDASFAGQGGVGADFGAITYIAVGFFFDAVGDTLANILVDEISFHTNQHVNAAINAEISSSVSSANVNVQKIGGSPTTKGAGNVANGSQRIVIATDDINMAAIKVSVEILDNAISGSEMQVDVVGALPAGTNLVGDVGISGARTSGGTTPYKNIDVDESEDEIKGSAGQIYWIHAINSTAAPLFLKLYDEVAASVTVGTTVPDHTFPVPGNADSDGAGFTLSIPNGIAFGTGITIAGTTAVADNDTGAPSANALVVNLGFA